MLLASPQESSYEESRPHRPCWREEPDRRAKETAASRLARCTHRKREVLKHRGWQTDMGQAESVCTSLCWKAPSGISLARISSSGHGITLLGMAKSFLADLLAGLARRRNKTHRQPHNIQTRRYLAPKAHQDHHRRLPGRHAGEMACTPSKTNADGTERSRLAYE
jgi:hypothetical protein